MSVLPCRYFLSKGELHREDDTLSFYRKFFGEQKLEGRWKDSDWCALRIYRSYFDLELHLILNSGEKKRFELSISQEELLAWADTVGLTLQTDDEPAPPTQSDSDWTPLPAASTSAKPEPLPSLLIPAAAPPPSPPEDHPPPPLEPPRPSAEAPAQQSVAAPPTETPSDDAPLHDIPHPEEPTKRPMAPLVMVVEPEMAAPAPATASIGRYTDPGLDINRSLITRMFPTTTHWIILAMLAMIASPFAAFFYVGFRYMQVQKESS